MDGLEQSLPAIAGINNTYGQCQTSMAAPYPALEERKPISHVRRTFCLFVTFDLLFVSLLWIIELNVSVSCLGMAERERLCKLPSSATLPVPFSLCVYLHVFISKHKLNAEKHWPHKHSSATMNL